MVERRGIPLIRRWIGNASCARRIGSFEFLPTHFKGGVGAVTSFGSRHRSAALGLLRAPFHAATGSAYLPPLLAQTPKKAPLESSGKGPQAAQIPGVHARSTLPWTIAGRAMYLDGEGERSRARAIEILCASVYKWVLKCNIPCVGAPNKRFQEDVSIKTLTVRRA
jgi:hypothetical protein